MTYYHKLAFTMHVNLIKVQSRQLLRKKPEIRTNKNLVKYLLLFIFDEISY